MWFLIKIFFGIALISAVFETGCRDKAGLVSIIFIGGFGLLLAIGGFTGLMKKIGDLLST